MTAPDSLRNVFEWDDLLICPLTTEDVAELPLDFCTDDDLNDFFKSDCLIYERGLWVKNYKVLYKESHVVLGLVSLLNDTLRFQAKAQKRKFTPHLKNWMESHPAMKVGRFAIRKELSGKGIGSKALNLLKAFFLDANRTGCRFLTVDAYNHPQVIAFYQRNGFVPIRTEAALASEDARTVSMFFPLFTLFETPAT